MPVSGWVWLMLGYLVGVIWSEAWLTRLPHGTHRTASLTPRRVAVYLVRRLRIAQVVVPATAFVLGIVALLVHDRAGAGPVESLFPGTPIETLRWLATGIGIGAVLLAGGVAWLQRRIVTKPQPESNLDLTLADDAVRAAAVHLLSGTTIGIVLVSIGTQMAVLAELGVISLGIAQGGSLVCWVAGLVAWRYYGQRAWVVPRGRKPGQSTTTLEVVGS